MASTDDLIRQIIKQSKQDRAGTQHLGRGGQPHRENTTVLDDIKSFKEPLSGLADAFAGALRGSVAGTVGFPGDLESLGRGALSALGAPSGARLDALISGMGQPTVLPTTERMRKVLPKATAYDNPYEELGTFMPLPGSTAAIRLADKGVAKMAENATKVDPYFAGKLGSQRGVVKMPGGNWLPESTKALEGLKGEDAALNNFIDKQLTRYVKNQMATPEDPIRALAEKGTLHFDAPLVQPTMRLEEKRRAFANKNEGKWGYGKSRMAQDWEDAADTAVTAQKAGDLQNAKQFGVYGAFPDAFHTREAAQNYIDQMTAFGKDNEVLGEELRRHPFRIADIGELNKNPWLAKLDPDTPIYSDNLINAELGFPHLIDELRNATNPESGLPRELLIKPESLSKLSVPQAVERVAKINEWRAAQSKAAHEGIPVHKEYPEGYKWLEASNTPVDEKALQYVIDAGCQGGWCTREDRLAKQYGGGGNTLYVLHDPKGKAVTQISVKPSWMEHSDAVRMAKSEGLKGFDFASRVTDLMAGKGVPPKIQEIKGKANLKPNEEYLPYVQDFVKSGQWSDVWDLHNTGLVRKSDLIDEFSPDQLDAIGAGEYVTPSEIEKLRGGMKRGGAVKPCDCNIDAMRLAVMDKKIRKHHA